MKKHLRLAALLATTILVLSSCSTQKQVRLVLLPDIQTYSRLYPDILRSQTQWAVRGVPLPPTTLIYSADCV